MDPIYESYKECLIESKEKKMDQAKLKKTLNSLKKVPIKTVMQYDSFDSAEYKKYAVPGIKNLEFDIMRKRDYHNGVYVVAKVPTKAGTEMEITAYIVDPGVLEDFELG